MTLLEKTKLNFFDLEFKSNEEDDNVFISGHISTNDVDGYGDLVSKNCQKSIFNQLKNKKITMDFEHSNYIKNGKVLKNSKSEIPVAKVVESELTNNGTFVKAKLNKYHPDFKSIYGSIKEGMLHSFSIAFKPIKTILKNIGDKSVRVLDDLELFNVALTGNPVNTNATFTMSLKSYIKKMDNDEYEKKLGEFNTELNDITKSHSTELKSAQDINTELTEQNIKLKAEIEKSKEDEEEDKKKKEEEDMKKKEEDKKTEIKSEINELKAKIEKFESRPIQKNTIETKSETKNETQYGSNFLF